MARLMIRAAVLDTPGAVRDKPQRIQGPCGFRILAVAWRVLAFACCRH